MRVIEEGLSADELYVVNGLLRARPGLPVSPQIQEATPPGDAPGDDVSSKVSTTDVSGE